jgi:hypothetical protein
MDRERELIRIRRILEDAPRLAWTPQALAIAQGAVAGILLAQSLLGGSEVYQAVAPLARALTMSEGSLDEILRHELCMPEA